MLQLSRNLLKGVLNIFFSTSICYYKLKQTNVKDIVLLSYKLKKKTKRKFYKTPTTNILLLVNEMIRKVKWMNLKKKKKLQWKFNEREINITKTKLTTNKTLIFNIYLIKYLFTSYS